MDSGVRPIAAVQGADSEAIQALLAQFVAGRRERLRIAGVIEQAAGTSCDCAPGHLLCLTSGRMFPIFQELGRGSTGCSLDPRGLVEAGEQVRADIAAGCDLVVISKFGKLEAEAGSGLRQAFVDAMSAGVPVLTSVSPKFRAEWELFASPFHVLVPACVEAIEQWWDGQSLPVRE